MSIKIFPMARKVVRMAEYARTKLFQFIDNANPAVGTHAVMSDEPIRCDYWTEPDPVTGDPVPKQWCPLDEDYQTYKYRMALEFALAAYATPNQTMLYFEKSTALAAAWAATSPTDKTWIKNEAWKNYDSKWKSSPNFAPEAPTE